MGAARPHGEEHDARRDAVGRWHRRPARLRALAAFHGVTRQRLCALLELELPGGEAAGGAAGADASRVLVVLDPSSTSRSKR